MEKVTFIRRQGWFYRLLIAAGTGCAAEITGPVSQWGRLPGDTEWCRRQPSPLAGIGGRPVWEYLPRPSSFCGVNVTLRRAWRVVPDGTVPSGTRLCLQATGPTVTFAQQQERTDSLCFAVIRSMKKDDKIQLTDSQFGLKIN
ncbi:MAG: hypothetical protein IJI14_04670 [Anaerolineaceae bacterium]|nr:hypothetical protein [Anaerolineaceae bacterium]